MQVSETANLRRMWGNKTCNHDEVEEEFSGDIPTGQFTCVKCGATFWSGDSRRIKHRHSR